VVADGHTTDRAATVDAFAFRLALWLSVAYMMLVVGFLFMYTQSANPIADLRASSKLVNALYAIVGIALGALFVTRKSSTDKEAGTG
jgi:hypothetical protein